MPQHVRYAVRLLLRAPLFTLTAVLSLAVGIGANTAIFTAANALLLAPTAGLLTPDRLVDIGASRHDAGLDTVSFPTYTEVRSRSRLFDGVYAVGIEPRPVSLVREGGAEPIFAQFVSASFFDVLGVTPGRGSFFRTAEEQVGVPLRKVVLNDRFWRRQFDADPSIVGRSIVLNGDSFLVVGVTPKGFHGTTILAPDIWVPLTAYGKAMPSDSLTRSRQSLWLVMGARLKPDVTVPQARAELASIGQALAQEFPDRATDSSGAPAGTALVVEPASRVPGEAGQAVVPIIVVLGSVVGLVLLIACVNLAGLLLVRAASRSREIALRVALGASRGDLVGQLLAESLLLFALGGGAGLLLARWMSAALVAHLPALPVPVDLTMTLDWRVVAFAAGLSLATGLLTGIGPAVWSSRTDLVAGLKTDDATPRRQRLRHAFLGAQMGLCLLLIVVAGLFLRALGAAVRADPGIRVAGIDVAAVDLSLGGYADARAVAATDEIRTRLAALPGVATVAAGAVVPLAGDGLGLGELRKPGTSGRDSNIDADWNVISPEYLAALGIPLVAGRNFGPLDRVDQPLVAIVNERFARATWPGEDPVGKTVENSDGGPGGSTPRVLTVVGVARDGKYRWIGDRPRNFIYVPVAQHTWQRVHFFVVRQPGLAASKSLMPEARAALKAFDANLPLIQMTPLQDFADLGMLPQRLAASVAGSLGTVALLLAVIGIYGVTAFAVTRRTREIGVRMALGADRSAVMWLVIGQALRLSAIGGALGLAAAAAMARLISGLLFGISPFDPVTFGGTVVALTLVTAAASYLPARRAARVDPMIALRAE
jgi:predicted permease